MTRTRFILFGVWDPHIHVKKILSSSWNPPNAPDAACQPFFELPDDWPTPCRQWDSHWLRLVQLCFSLLQWPPVDTPGQVSFVELLFDMLFSFSVSAPQDLQKHRDISYKGPQLSNKEYDSSPIILPSVLSI